ncbi:exo-beta 1,3 glucanase-like protein [Lindgomyces ingoldianus]|uniref:Exo-beta 1,3 glucanase-like protein n=1 Tax=Lindgomyces ingoldianus TaxID=673940 RepID=A0ACB6QDV4_9PLEO|nr:exo-beta 1,3 glucanase-like protein [Lindgomyces ingoldianus]KAF2464680.1 exo-beta 1,3 glucanase-like protein [Lindgomyces ingoldianus]
MANLTTAAPVKTTLATISALPTPSGAISVLKPAVAASGYWMADMPKQGIAAFNSNPNGYKVWRNVKDYGAKGDGATDDSAAINAAITDGNRCGPWVCQSATDTPAVVYFPSGTYIISQKIVPYYFTQIIGNPNNRPVLKATAGFTALGVIDASPYGNTGQPGWLSTNLFMRQIRNIVIDLTAIAPATAATGIHWPAAQATSLQNVKVIMTQSASSQHQGIFIENGSAGMVLDIETVGGLYGLNIGNQQFTMRNIKISKAVTGISQIWNWGWTYHGLTISDCTTAFSMKNGGSSKQEVGSVTIIDSTITNCPTFVEMAWSTSAKPIAAGQLILENIALSNVPVAVKGEGGTVLAGGSTTIAAWGQGIKYTPTGPTKWQGAFTPAKRPTNLLSGNKFYTKSKPQYEDLVTDSFISARASGAKGDGNTDDTTAVQNAINNAVQAKKILFFDHGVYKVTKTIYVPPGARMVGESFAVIMASGSTWSSKTNPVPVIQIGKPGESGSVEWSDMVVSTQGSTPGAKLIEWNLAATLGSGLWDVHTRIGGAKGTNLQVTQCPVGAAIKDDCMAAYMSVHITKTGSGAYLENNWFWTADHDLDDAKNNSTQISIYTGRGLLVEGSNVWLWSSGVEHHSLYQYQFANAKDVFAGFIQTETPYWQPNPDAKNQPFPLASALSDPDYNSACQGASGNCDTLGLRILDSQNVLIYGAGLYSFFINNNSACSGADIANGKRICQTRIFSVEGKSTNVLIYGLSTVGVEKLITIDGNDKATWSDTLSVYSDTIGLFSYNV